MNESAGDRPTGQQKPPQPMLPKILLQGIAIAITSVVFLSKPRITCSEALYLSIQVGMTRRDVEQILCAPPGEYTSAAYSYFPPDCFLRRNAKWITWVADDGAISVLVDGNDTVLAKEFSSVLLIEDCWFQLKFYLHRLFGTNVLQRWVQQI
jgi:hypothetical protein